MLAVVGCKERGAPPPGPAAGSGSGSGSSSDGAVDGEPCTPVPFAASTPVPEASGAAWVTVDGEDRLLVISDSGHGGAYGLVDPDTGETVETGTLPLGAGAGDDLEGVATRGGRVHAITSAGWVRTWTRGDGGFELVDGPYPAGRVELPDTGGLGDKPPAGEGMVCGARGVNCGRNYEGLCLRDGAAPDGAPCIGWAASKADGHLYCVRERDGKLAVSFAPRIRIARPGTLGDCAFGDDGALWVGANLFEMARVWQVRGWEHPEAATLTEVGSLGSGFPEALAVRGEHVYRMSDTGGAPSLMLKLRCQRR